MKYLVSKTFQFDSAHRLLGHPGKCLNLHGHRYTAEVTLSANTLDHLGMVIDFSSITRLIGGWIDANWDHNVLLNIDDPMKEALVGVCTQKPYLFEQNPTAEIMARVLFEEVIGLLHLAGVPQNVVSVKLWETPSSCAVYPG